MVTFAARGRILKKLPVVVKIIRHLAREGVNR